MPARPDRSRPSTSFPVAALALYAFTTLTLYLLAVLFAAALPMPIDPIEATVAQLSWLALHGQPVYTALHDAGRYSLLYGPMCYLPYATALALLGPSLVSLKIAVVFCNLLLLAAIYLAFRRLLQPMESLAATGLIACEFTPHLMTMFLIRGDVLMALAVSVARELDWRPSRRPLWRYALPAFAVVLIFPLLKQVVELKPIGPGRRGYALAVSADIDAIEHAHPGKTIEIGYGQTTNPLQPLSPLSYFRPQLVFHGNPVSFDAGALFDMGLSGQTLPPATVAGMAHCGTSLWLIPANEQPFEVTNIYFNDTHAISNQLFTPSFRQAFLTHYTRIGQSQFFDLWQCKK